MAIGILICFLFNIYINIYIYIYKYINPYLENDKLTITKINSSNYYYKDTNKNIHLIVKYTFKINNAN